MASTAALVDTTEGKRDKGMSDTVRNVSFLLSRRSLLVRCLNAVCAGADHRSSSRVLFHQKLTPWSRLFYDKIRQYL